MTMNTTALIEELDKTASELEALALDPNTKVASASGSSLASDTGAAFMLSMAASLGLVD